MKVSAKELASLLGGEVEGDPTVKVDRPAKIEEGTAGSLTFLANSKYEQFAYSSQASVILVSKKFKPKKQMTPTMVRVDDVYSSMAKLMQHFQPEVQQASGIDGNSSVHSSVVLGQDVSLAAFSVISEDCTLGDGCVLFPHVYLGPRVQLGTRCVLHPGVRIYHECILGNDVIVHSNTVIGSDGFGYAPTPDGSYEKIPQVGNVVIGNQVEIGANCAIDRASMGSTVIKDGAKLDNLVHIAHNVTVGSHTALAGQVGIAGSTKIGAYCQIGGQAGLVGHISIGDRTMIQAQSGVTKSTDKGEKIQGSPAMKYVDYFKSYAVFRRLAEWSRRWKNLEDRVKHLEQGSAD